MPEYKGAVTAWINTSAPLVPAPASAGDLTTTQPAVGNQGANSYGTSTTVRTIQFRATGTNSSTVANPFAVDAGSWVIPTYFFDASMDSGNALPANRYLMAQNVTVQGEVNSSATLGSALEVTGIIHKRSAAGVVTELARSSHAGISLATAGIKAFTMTIAVPTTSFEPGDTIGLTLWGTTGGVTITGQTVTLRRGAGASSASDTKMIFSNLSYLYKRGGSPVGVAPSSVSSPWTGFSNAHTFDTTYARQHTGGWDCGPNAKVTGAFCLELKVRTPAAFSLLRALAGRFTVVGGGAGPILYVTSGGGLNGQVRNAAGTQVNLAALAAMSVSTNYDAALTWDGTTLRLFQDGVLQSSVALAGLQAQDTTTRFMIGRAHDVLNGATQLESWNGTIDEVRLSNVARYTANYTPSSSPFTSDANTVGLWHLDTINAATATLPESTPDSGPNGYHGYAIARPPAWSSGITPAGALVKTPNRFFTGSAGTPSGALTKVAQKALAGGLTPTGALVKTPNKFFTGAVTMAGSLLRTPLKALSGSVNLAGTVTRLATKVLTGSVAVIASVLLKVTLKPFTGSITPAGALRRIPNKYFVGASTPGPGSLIRTPVKRLTGAITPGPGTLQRLVYRFFAGTITPAGTVLKRSSKYFTGSAGTPAGALRKIPNKYFVGSITPGPGSILRVLVKSLAGSITSVGTLVRNVYKTLAGTVTPSSTLKLTLGKNFRGFLYGPAGDGSGGGGPTIINKIMNIIFED